MTHVCHAEGCRTPVKPAKLMCHLHWAMVSKTNQRRVWATYVPGQEIAKNPTAAYIQAARAAIDEVAEKEARAAALAPPLFA